MSIEYRAVLTKTQTFQSGLELEEGTVIYVEETQHGWVAKHMPNPKAAGGTIFQLEPEDFSMFRSDDLSYEIIVVPDPVELDEEAKENAALARRRMQSTIDRMREKADELEVLLQEGS